MVPGLVHGLFPAFGRRKEEGGDRAAGGDDEAESGGGTWKSFH